MRAYVMGATALAALVGTALATPPAPAPDPAKPEPKLVCKRISDNPSDKLTPRRKVCLTAEQWKEARRNRSAEMPEQQGAPSRY